MLPVWLVSYWLLWHKGKSTVYIFSEFRPPFQCHYLFNVSSETSKALSVPYLASSTFPHAVCCNSTSCRRVTGTFCSISSSPVSSKLWCHFFTSVRPTHEVYRSPSSPLRLKWKVLHKFLCKKLSQYDLGVPPQPQLPHLHNSLVVYYWGCVQTLILSQPCNDV